MTPEEHVSDRLGAVATALRAASTESVDVDAAWGRFERHVRSEEASSAGAARPAGSLSERQRRRRVPVLLGAAASIAVVVAAMALVFNGDANDTRTLDVVVAPQPLPSERADDLFSPIALSADATTTELAIVGRTQSDDLSGAIVLSTSADAYGMATALVPAVAIDPAPSFSDAAVASFGISNAAGCVESVRLIVDPRTAAGPFAEPYLLVVPTLSAEPCDGDAATQIVSVEIPFDIVPKQFLLALSHNEERPNVHGAPRVVRATRDSAIAQFSSSFE